MINKTKLNEEFIISVKKEIKLSGMRLTKYLTYSFFFLVAAIVLFCIYRSSNEILGLLLPAIIIVATIGYSVYFFGNATSWGKKGSKEIFIVEYLFDNDFIKITMEDKSYAISYSRINKTYFVGNYLVLATDADPLMIDKNGFIDCTYNDLKNLLSQKNINIE